MGLPGLLSHNSFGRGRPGQRAETGQRLGDDARCAGEPGTRCHTSGRRPSGMPTRSPGAEAEQRRQPGDELLAADRRRTACDGSRPGTPRRRSNHSQIALTHVGGPDCQRVAGGIGGLGERRADELRRRVDRGADGQVDDSVRVRGPLAPCRARASPTGSRGGSGRCTQRVTRRVPAAAGPRSAGGPCRSCRAWRRHPGCRGR